MAHTHQLPSISGRWISTIWQMTGEPQSGLQSSLWLSHACLSGKNLWVWVFFTKTLSWRWNLDLWRMSSFGCDAGPEEGDPKNRMFAVSVFLSEDWMYKQKKKMTHKLHLFAVHLDRCLCIQTGRQGTNKTVPLSHLRALEVWTIVIPTIDVNQTFFFPHAEGGGMSERRVSGNPQEEASLCGGRAVHEPASSWRRRVGFHLRVGGEGRLLSAMSAESHGAEEASPRPGRPKLTEGWFQNFFQTLLGKSHSQIYTVLLLFAQWV